MLAIAGRKCCFLQMDMDAMDPGGLVDSSMDSTIEPKFDPSLSDSYGDFDSFSMNMSRESAPRNAKSVHQCTICSKIFVSLKGLQQHLVVHTDQKPFTCEICQKSFRFKSNLFEHRSVHQGFTPHSCPYCGKTCRLKGNLKKHLKTHVTSKAELDEAWRPFASNRRPPAEIPHDAIIVRGGSDQLFTPPTRNRKRKVGLGQDATIWVEKIRRGEILPQANMDEKMRRLEDLIENAEKNSFNIDDFFNQARALAFEKFTCPMCKDSFLSRLECSEHLELMHPGHREQRPLFCEVCVKSFADRKSMEQHESYHKRVHDLIQTNELILIDPELVLPQADEDIENLHDIIGQSGSGPSHEV